jgi:hypothetical protein
LNEEFSWFITIHGKISGFFMKKYIAFGKRSISRSEGTKVASRIKDEGQRSPNEWAQVQHG